MEDDRADLISHAATVIPVRNVRQSAEFYVNQLGFINEFEYGEPVYYIILRRGGVVIHLTEKKELENQNGRPILYVFVHDIDKLYREFKSKGLNNISTLSRQDYDMRDFDITDPDGYQITFGSGEK